MCACFLLLPLSLPTCVPACLSLLLIIIHHPSLSPRLACLSDCHAGVSSHPWWMPGHDGFDGRPLMLRVCLWSYVSVVCWSVRLCHHCVSARLPEALLGLVRLHQGAHACVCVGVGQPFLHAVLAGSFVMCHFDSDLHPGLLDHCRQYSLHPSPCSTYQVFLGGSQAGSTASRS